MNATLRCRIDAWTSENAQNANHGDTGRLKVQSDASARRRAFIFFPRPFPLGSVVSLAQLQLVLANTWPAAAVTLTIERINSGWKEGGPGGVTWNTEPTVTGTAVTASVASASPAGTVVIADVTSIMQSAANGTNYFGMRITANTTGEKHFYSAEAADPLNSPRLDVTWSEPPDAPTSLHPSGGLGVSPTKPVVEWFAADQAQYQVQVDDTSDLSSPIYDSGMVVGTDTQLDLNTTAIVALTDNTTYYWRVRIINADGQTSPWSDIASFVRRSKGVLTITSPSGATVDDMTPNLTHTFTGRTQAAVRYIIEEQSPTDSKYYVRYDSGKIVTTATAFTLPHKNADGKQIIRVEARNYRLTLRVWDNQQRENSAGDTAYVEAQAVFTYVRNGTPTALTSFTLVGGATSDPTVNVAFARAVRPDYFALKIDGEIYDKRIDPAAVEDSPGANTYHMTVWNCPPGAHTLAMEAVVVSSGKFINSNPSNLSVTVAFKNKWLLAPNSNLKVCIIDPGDPDAVIGQDGETFFPLGRRDPVRINSMVRGYEGTVGGALYDYNGVTAAQYKANYERLVGLENTEEIRLAWRDMNIEVALGDVVAPVLTINGWALAGVEFWQTDNFTFPVRK